jgi:hypothetical protein
MIISKISSKKKKKGVNMGAKRCNDYIYILKKNFKTQRDMGYGPRNPGSVAAKEKNPLINDYE